MVQHVRKKKIISMLILLLALIASAGLAHGGKNEAESLWELGEKAYDAGRYSEALFIMKNHCLNAQVTLSVLHLTLMASVQFMRRWMTIKRH